MLCLLPVQTNCARLRRCQISAILKMDPFFCFLPDHGSRLVRNVYRDLPGSMSEQFRSISCLAIIAISPWSIRRVRNCGLRLRFLTLKSQCKSCSISQKMTRLKVIAESINRRNAKINSAFFDLAVTTSSQTTQSTMFDVTLVLLASLNLSMRRYP